MPTDEYLATQVVDDNGVKDGGDPGVSGGVDEDFTQARERGVVCGKQDWLRLTRTGNGIEAETVFCQGCVVDNGSTSSRVRRA